MSTVGEFQSAALASRAAAQPAYFSAWGLQAFYGESYIVQDVSFNVHEGEIVALLGRNGAGKTSTLRAIARVDTPSLKAGEIWLDRKPLHEMKAHQAARHGIGVGDIQQVIETAIGERLRRVRRFLDDDEQRSVFHHALCQAPCALDVMVRNRGRAVFTGRQCDDHCDQQGRDAARVDHKDCLSASFSNKAGSFVP